MTAEKPRDLFASVATYTVPPVDAAAKWLDHTFNSVLRPHLDPAETQVFVRWCKKGSQRQQSAAYDSVQWDTIVGSAPLAWLVISAWREANLETTQSPSVAAVTVRFAEDPRRASVFECSITTRLLGESIERAVQEQIVRWATTTFTSFEGVVGYITVDYVSANVFGSMSPYETMVGLSYPWAAMEFREKLRGYFWGNLLHRDHVAALGGAAALQQIGATVQPLDERGYYLQLTDDINNIDRAKLARLKQIVQPLLPEGYPQSPEYYKNQPDFIL